MEQQTISELLITLLLTATVQRLRRGRGAAPAASPPDR